jgi:hypothetical protein
MTDAKEIGWKSVVWIYPAQDKDQWQAIVNPVMNPRLVIRVTSWLVKQLLASQVALHSMDFFSFLSIGA